MTFEDRYCRAHRCDVTAFRNRVFWRCVPPAVRPLAAIGWICRRRFFLPDERFVIGVAEAQCIDDVRREARDYLQGPANQGWLRRVVSVRVSARRMIALTKIYLPDGDLSGG